MLEKSYRELHDGLGTVAIELNLSKRRLSRLQEKADGYQTSVDSMISDAIDNYLVSSEKDTPTEIPSFDRPQVEALQKENRLLKALISTLPQPKRAYRKRAKKHSSSSLQMYLPLVTPKGMRIDFTQMVPQEIDMDKKFVELDESPKREGVMADDD